MTSILDQLRDAARHDGRPQMQIANAAGISPTTFYAFIAGRRGLSVETAEHLATVLGRPLQLAPVAPAAAERKAVKRLAAAAKIVGHDPKATFYDAAVKIKEQREAATPRKRKVQP